MLSVMQGIVHLPGTYRSLGRPDSSDPSIIAPLFLSRRGTP
jgi:hypothetical protein